MALEKLKDVLMSSRVILLAAMTVGCGTQKSLVMPTAVSNGYSGMAMIDDTRYLVVHDELSHEDGARISVLEITGRGPATATPVRPASWQHVSGRSNDLEDVCAIPGRAGEFLLVEAGHWAGDFGRLFHVKINVIKQPYDIAVLRTFDLPEFDAKGPTDPEGDENEGLACASREDGSTLVILGERGGSGAYRSGLLRWAVVDLDMQEPLRFSPIGLAGKQVDAPGNWRNEDTNRDISALYLDSDNFLWAAASEDHGDSGPFKSVVFQIGRVRPDAPNPIQLIEQSVVSHTVDGFKIESLAAPTSLVPSSVFAIATEDEDLGGIWRAL